MLRALLRAKEQMKTKVEKKANERVRIGSLAELKQRCAEPLIVEFELDGSTIELPVRRLVPDEEASITALDDEVQPPLIKGARGGEDRYDVMDSAYLKKKSEVGQTIRALTIYQGCKLVQDERPNLTDRKEITSFIQGLFTNNILDIIFLRIRQGGVSLAERVNFT